MHVLSKMPMELTKMIAGALVYGELKAKSTKLRAPWMSTSKEAIERLKLTFQAMMTIVSVRWTNRGQGGR